MTKVFVLWPHRRRNAPATAHAMKTPKRPTEAECNLLGVLWERESATVRQVHEALLAKGQEVGYTTVLKLMQIMTEKELVVRDSSVRPQVYRAARPRKETQRMLVGDLLDRAFVGSAGSLVLQALSLRKSSDDELRAIRELIDRQLDGEESAEGAGPTNEAPAAEEEVD